MRVRTGRPPARSQVAAGTAQSGATEPAIPGASPTVPIWERVLVEIQRGSLVCLEVPEIKLAEIFCFFLLRFLQRLT